MREEASSSARALSSLPNPPNPPNLDNPVNLGPNFFLYY
jgi:hypothetical protein